MIFAGDVQNRKIPKPFYRLHLQITLLPNQQPCMTSYFTLETLVQYGTIIDNLRGITRY